MSKIVPSKSVKRHGSPIASGSGSKTKQLCQKKVEMFEIAWLEVLKSLSCPNWSKTRLVSRQLNGMVQKNISRLPLAIIDDVEMRLEQRENIEIVIIDKDSVFPFDQKIQWFKDRGINLNLPADIELNNAIIGVDFKEKQSVDLVIRGDKEKFNASVLFKAEFSPHRNPYSWPSMAYFLKLIYDQSTYIKELSMYAIDNKLKNILFSNEEKHYIHCGSFKLQMSNTRFQTGWKSLSWLENLNVESMSWLEQNIQADKIELPTIEYYHSKIGDAVSNFLLGASWISVNQMVDLGRVNSLEAFFRTLIKKFRTVSAVQSTFPIILCSGFLTFHEVEWIKQLLSREGQLEDLEDAHTSENIRIHNKYSGGYEHELDGKTYTISNGVNRMRVEFLRPPPYTGGPRRSRCQPCKSGPRTKYDHIRVTVKTSK
ncbi:hypothetical protein Ddc_12476 [Ditylenchus destructor]|nr:hypothetical protein Ddc_12476 [Ditylenchus destructor]